MATEVERMISELSFRLEQETKILKTLILSVPTGEKRNELCDANIHLIGSIQHLVKAVKL